MSRPQTLSDRKSRYELPPAWEKALRSYTSYLKLADRSSGTIELRIYHMRRFAYETGVDPWDVKFSDITDFLGEKTWSNETHRAVRSSLIGFYKWAVDAEKIDQSPAEKVPYVKPRTPKPNPVPEDVYRRALKTADPIVKMALRLAGDLGMRRAEVAQVHEDHLIDTGEGHLLLILGKGRKERHIPISDTFAQELRDHFTQHGKAGYAFPDYYGGHMTPHWVGTLCSRALGEGYTMHKLRHRALTQAYLKSKDLLLTATLAGHSSVSTTQAFYVKPDYTALRGIVEGIAS